MEMCQLDTLQSMESQCMSTEHRGKTRELFCDIGLDSVDIAAEIDCHYIVNKILIMLRDWYL